MTESRSEKVKSDSFSRFSFSSGCVTSSISSSMNEASALQRFDTSCFTMSDGFATGSFSRRKRRHEHVRHGRPLQDPVVADHELELARPRIHEARPLGAEHDVAAVVHQKPVRLADERGARRLPLHHHRLVRLAQDRHIVRMVQLHDRPAEDVLRQVPDRLDRATVDVAQHARRRVARVELQVALAQRLVRLPVHALHRRRGDDQQYAPPAHDFRILGRCLAERQHQPLTDVLVTLKPVVFSPRYLRSITYSEFLWSFWPLFDSPSGTTTFDVIWLANVARSFGCTKSMNERPSHMSFGKPRLCVMLGVLVTTTTSGDRVDDRSHAGRKGSRSRQNAMGDPFLLHVLVRTVQQFLRHPLAPPVAEATVCSTATDSPHPARFVWSVAGACGPTMVAVLPEVATVPVVVPPADDPFGPFGTTFSADVLSFFFLRSLSFERLTAGCGSGAMLLVWVDAFPP
uniref:Uncharacterized protein n=1 Tax=Anopheles farauti TaxID=69004 RepID=A0A182Q6Q3_9DIPT